MRYTEAQRYRDFILLTYTIFPLCLRDSVFDILRFDTASHRKQGGRYAPSVSGTAS